MLHMEWAGLLNKLNLNVQPLEACVNKLCVLTRSIVMLTLETQKLATSSTLDNVTNISTKIHRGITMQNFEFNWKSFEPVRA